MQNTPLPSIKELFKQSWITYKQSLLNLFLLSLVSLFVGVAVLMVFTFLVFVLLLTTGLTSHLSLSNFSSVFNNPVVVVGLVVILVIYSLVASVIQSGYFGAIIYAVANSNEKPGLGLVLKKGFSRAMPLFLTGFITSFLILGAFVPFVFPALVVGFFLSFVAYEVILEGKKFNGAVASSVGVVTAHFGDIFVRALLMLVISLAVAFVMYLPQFVLQIIDAAIKSSSLLSSIWRILMIIPNLLVSWFTLVYSVTLYKQARSITPSETKSKTFWLWAIAIFGWVVLVLTMVGAGFLVKANWSLIQNKLNPPKTKTVEQKTLSPEAQKLLDMSLAKLDAANKLAAKKNLTQTDKDQIANLVAGAISDAKQVTNMEPSNTVGWYNLGKIYFELRNFASGSIDWAETSYNQAINLDPSNYIYRESLGGLYMNNKDYINAISQFQRETQLAPNYANGYYNLGFAYKYSGQIAKAKEAFQKSLSLLSLDSKDRSLIEKELK